MPYYFGHSYTGGAGSSEQLDRRSCKKPLARQQQVRLTTSHRSAVPKAWPMRTVRCRGRVLQRCCVSVLSTCSLPAPLKDGLGLASAELDLAQCHTGLLVFPYRLRSPMSLSSELAVLQSCARFAKLWLTRIVSSSCRQYTVLKSLERSDEIGRDYHIRCWSTSA